MGTVLTSGQHFVKKPVTRYLYAKVEGGSQGELSIKAA